MSGSDEIGSTRSSEEEARQLVDAYMWNSPVAVVEFDPHDRVIRWSAEAERIFGYSADEILGQSIFDRKWVHEDDASLVASEVELLLSGRVSKTRSVNRNYRKDGSVIWCEWHSSTIRDESGRLQSVLSLVLDITERRNSEERLAILAESNALLLQADDPEQVIRTLGERVMGHLKADVFFNYVLDPGAERLRLNAWGGVDERVAQMIERLELGQAICGCVAQAGERIISEDVQNNADPRADLVRRMGVRCYCCHPLKFGDATVGTLSFGTKSKDCFDDDEVELMRIVAAQISIAMRRVRSEGEARRELAKTRVLEAAAEAATTGTSLERVASNVLAALTRHMDLQMGIVYVCRDLSDKLELLTHEGMPPAYAEEYRHLPVVKDGPALVSQAAAQRRVITSSEVSMTPHRTELLRAGGLLESKSIAIPIVSATKLLGVLSVVFGREHDFTSDEREMFTSLARILAQAFENAQLYQSQRARRRRIQALHDIVQVALTAEGVREAAQLILEQLSGHDFELSSIWLASAESLELVAQVGFSAVGSRRLALTEPFDEVSAFASGHKLVVRRPAKKSAVEESLPTDASLAAYAVLPLRARGHTLGVVNLAWTTPRELNDYDVAFLDSVADEIAVVLENVRLYETEHNIAETLQETLVLLPASLPEITFSRAYESATAEIGRVGGDFMDLFEVGTNTVGIVVGDVSGKGVDAAVITSLVRNTVRAHAVDGLAPSSVIEKTNTVMRRFTAVEAYVTMFFGLLNTRTGLLRYVSAGHPPALLLEEGSVEEAASGQNPIVGAFDDASFHEAQTIMRSGDRLVLYTDGVTEARSPEDAAFLDVEGLQALLRTHSNTETSHLAEVLMSDVVRFSHEVLRDDAAILVVEPKGIDEKRNASKR